MTNNIHIRVESIIILEYQKEMKMQDLLSMVVGKAHALTYAKGFMSRNNNIVYFVARDIFNCNQALNIDRDDEHYSQMNNKIPQLPAKLRAHVLF